MKKVKFGNFRQVFYDMGVSFQMLMGIHAGLAILTFINAYVNQPWEPIPGPMDLSYRFNVDDC